MANKIVRLLLTVSMLGLSLTANERSLTVVDGEMTEVETEVETHETEPEIVETHEDVIAALKDEIHETRNWEVDCTDNTIKVTQEEADLMMRVAYAEAGTEGIEGQYRVLEVIWNRKEDEAFPSTIAEVVYQPNAFTTVKKGLIDSVTPTWETHMALAMLESHKCLDENLIGFETLDNGASLLSYFDYYDAFGNHVFYTKKMD